MNSNRYSRKQSRETLMGYLRPNGNQAKEAVEPQTFVNNTYKRLMASEQKKSAKMMRQKREIMQKERLVLQKAQATGDANAFL